MSTTLPPAASLEQLRNRAKTLVRSIKAHDPEASALARTHLPRLAGASIEDVFANPLTLAEAQLVIARDHGFASWPLLKRHVEAQELDHETVVDLFKKAVHEGDYRKLRRLLSRSALLQQQIDSPWFGFDSPAIVQAAGRRSREMVEVLLKFGADINARSSWWAGGFGVLPCESPEFAAFLIERGAVVDAHAAAGMNRPEQLAEILQADPAQVNARGGDGQTPLHYATTIEIASYLLDHGAEIDIRDIDHGGTPAQYMAVDRPEICRFLLERGAQPDIFMAVQLNDAALVRRLLAENPSCVRDRVNEGNLTAPGSEGGHIYTYTLPNGQSPLYLAAILGHKEIYELLAQHSTPVECLLAACLGADEARARQIITEHPGIVGSLEPGQMRLIADAAWSHNTPAVRLMLDLGLDIEARGDHHSTALNRAAVRGYIDLVDLLLERGASLEAANEFGGKPLGAALWGAENFRDRHGDYPGTVQRMLDAGAALGDIRYPNGDRKVNAVLRRHLEKLSATNIIAAIMLGRIGQVERLLERDADLVNRKTAGILPLYQAISSNQPDIVALLLNRGANPELKQEETGNTALEVATTAGHDAIAALLHG